MNLIAVATVWPVLLLLFVLVAAGVWSILAAAVGRSQTRRRLRARSGRARRVIADTKFAGRVNAHLSAMLKGIRSSVTAAHFGVISALLLIGGLLAGILFFGGMKAAVSLGVMGLLLPYGWLRLRLLNEQMINRINFLPAVELFYQTYVLCEPRNIRHVLRLTLEGDRLQYAMKAVFEQLYRGLTLRGDEEECFRVFELTLGSVWAEHFISIVRIGMQEGADLSDSLNELIADMRRAERANQVERNSLLEIRIANFTPLLFLGVFLAVNFKLDKQQAYYYYVLSEAGRDMLLNAIILIGLSFVMGIYLSMRRM